MTTKATATFEIDKWDEHPTHESDDGRKMTRATVTKRYQGELIGVGTMDYVMAYAPDGTASYVGLERVEGEIGGRTGTFVFQDVGGFRDGVAESEFRILDGSGTGGLQGIRGTARVDAVHADTQTMHLDYELDG